MELLIRMVGHTRTRSTDCCGGEVEEYYQAGIVRFSESMPHAWMVFATSGPADVAEMDLKPKFVEMMLVLS